MIQTNENPHKRELRLALMGLGIIIYFWIFTLGGLAEDIAGLLLPVMVLVGILSAVYLLFPKSIKALIWKEIVEIRRVWLMVFCSILFITVINKYDVGFFGLNTLILLLYSAFIGAKAFAGEREKGTLAYLDTRPIHPLTTLWVKYLLGIIQICLLTFVVVLLCDPDSLQHLIGNGNNWTSTVLTIFSVLLSLYSFCFWISIMVGDTVRAFLIGFPGALLTGFISIFIISLYQSNSSLNSETLVLLRKSFLFLNIAILLFGIIGITYKSVYQKHFVWKTVFLVFIPLAFYLVHYSNILFSGDMLPVSDTQSIHFQSYAGINEQSYWNGKVYGFDVIHNQLRIKVVDIHDPKFPIAKNVMILPKETTMTHFDLENNRLYTIENSWQPGPVSNYLIKSWGAKSTEMLRDFTPDRPRLVVWDISDLNHPKELARIKFIPQIDKPPFNEHISPISVNDRYITVTYSLETGREYLDYRNKPTPTPTDRIRRNLYETHILQIDKKTLQIANQFDTGDNGFIYMFYRSQIFGHYRFEGYTNQEISISDITDLSHPQYIRSIKWDYLKTNSYNYFQSFTIQDHYLYVVNGQHVLEIYDIADVPHLKQIGTVDWDWIDTMNDSNIIQSYNLQWGVYVKNNRAVLTYNRGFIVFDISNPHHPKQIGKMTSDQIYSSTLGDGYLYASSRLRGFSFYRIP